MDEPQGATISLKAILRALTALAMVTVGVLHFARAPFFVAIVPAYLPYPEALVAISGVAEITGGLGLLVPRTRRLAAWGLILLYIAVFPANINMAIHHIEPGGTHLSSFALWARLPFQALFIAIAYWFTKP
jgi:uncharacterized membrane protein